MSAPPSPKNISETVPMNTVVNSVKNIMIRTNMTQSRKWSTNQNIKYNIIIIYSNCSQQNVPNIWENEHLYWSNIWLYYNVWQTFVCQTLGKVIGITIWQTFGKCFSKMFGKIFGTFCCISSWPFCSMACFWMANVFCFPCMPSLPRFSRCCWWIWQWNC